MSESGKRPRSIEILGTKLKRGEIDLIIDTVEMLPNNSRRELSRTICENLSWGTSSGTYREQFCLRVLERFEELGLVTLPEKRKGGGGRLKPPVRTAASEPGDPVAGRLADLEPVSLEPASEGQAAAEWRELTDRYHPRGFKAPMGRWLGYFIIGRGGVRLGCMMFDTPGALACRDEWIGWSRSGREARLGLVLRNSRFLIFPWVRVRNLASRALSLAAKRAAEDWRQRWGVKPVLAETFVDGKEHDGAACKAANWRMIGHSKRGREVYAVELEPDARRILKEGRAKRSRSAPARRKAAGAAQDRSVRLWSGIAAAAAAAAEKHDLEWRVRIRSIGTFLVMMFVYRLVFGEGRTYAAAIDELWESRRVHGAFGCLDGPVTAAAMSKARAKVKAAVFKQTHAAILAEAELAKEWNGRRVFAVDGCKINLPRELIKAGFGAPGPHAHYPQGLVSCLFEITRGIPFDFELHAHASERDAARAHLPALSAGDIAVYDRGYYAFELLAGHLDRGLDAVFRLKSNANKQTAAFLESDLQQSVIALPPPGGGANPLARFWPEPPRVRLLKYSEGGSEFVILTTLLDETRFPSADIAALYGKRWSIEEFHKTAKRSMGVESFSAKSENGVRQELYACFNMIAAVRLSAGMLEEELNRGPGGGAKLQVNLKNALGAAFRNLEALMIRQADAVAETVLRCLEAFARCAQAERPNRSYPRKSRKPVNKWNRRK